MRTTSFSSNTLSASQDMPIPPSYKSYFDQMMQSMMNYPFDDADEKQVADQVYAAACDESDRLRYLAGPDVEEMAKLRWSQSEEKYLTAMRDLMGQITWRNSMKSKD